MGTPVFTSNPGHAPHHSLCAWPRCYRETNSLPICWEHALEAHGIVQATFSAMMEQSMKRAMSAPDEPRPGFVYFIRFADRIKIGFSADPRTRIASLPHDEVLGIFPGTRRNEKQLHAAFADLRLTGEWFQVDGRILDFVADVKDQTAA